MEFVQPLRTKEEISAMKHALLKQSERNYIMFMVGINAGLRISDILLLKIRDVRGKHIKIIEQKTQKPKYIVINPVLRKALDNYIKGKNNNDYLIKSRVGSNKPISRTQAYNILKRASETCGLTDVATHTMRKTFAYHLYQKNKDVGAVQRILNHDKQTTTMRYIGIEQDYQDSLVNNNNL